MVERNIDFPANISIISQKIKVCGHPLRLKILFAMGKGDETCVTELWRCLKKPQPVISQHLAILKQKGIVKSMIAKNKRIYCIIDPFIKKIIQLLLNTV